MAFRTSSYTQNFVPISGHDYFKSELAHYKLNLRVRMGPPCFVPVACLARTIGVASVPEALLTSVGD